MRKDRRGTAIRDWRRLEVWHRLHFCWIRHRAAMSRLYVIALSFIVNCPTDGQVANLRFTKRCPILNVLYANLEEEALQSFLRQFTKLTLDHWQTLTLLCGLTTCNKEKKLCYLHFSTEWNWIHKIFVKTKMMIALSLILFSVKIIAIKKYQQNLTFFVETEVANGFSTKIPSNQLLYSFYFDFTRYFSNGVSVRRCSNYLLFSFVKLTRLSYKWNSTLYNSNYGTLLPMFLTTQCTIAM